MDPSTVAGFVGAVVLALVGWIGKSAATVLRERARRREIATAGETEITKRREERPWALMEGRIDDLEGALDRLSGSNDKLRAENDRLRDERDKARTDCVDWQIEAHKASGALARIAELQQQCEQERLRHAEEIRGLREQIARLRRRRGDG